MTDLEAENARLRAELAAERSALDIALTDKLLVMKHRDKLKAENATMREALERCVEQLEAYDKDVPESARAVLRETKGGGGE